MASFVDRADRPIAVEHHDLRFPFTPSVGAAYRRTANTDPRRAGSLAARYRLDRFDRVSGVIHAWGNLNGPAEAGDRRFGKAAETHLSNAARYLARPDASTFHTCHMDFRTSASLCGTTHHDQSKDSRSTRGQVWAIYGFALGDRYRGREALAERSGTLANHFLNRAAHDLTCDWNVIFTDGDEPRDTSVAATTVCGLLEPGRHPPIVDPACDLHACAAWGMIRQLDRNGLAGLEQSHGLLADGVYPMPNRIGMSECCISGGYFPLKALVRMRRIWSPYP